MQRRVRHLVVVFLVSSYAIALGTHSHRLMAGEQPTNQQTVAGSRAAIATVHPLATQAGQRAMQSGGNAVDGAIAAALTLGVVDGHNSGLGGGCLILIRRADGQFLAIDGREKAPAHATRDMYRQGEKVHGEWSQTGALAIAVPGALAAYHAALQEAGKLTLPDLLIPAAELAEKGFPIDRVMAGAIENNKQVLREFPATRAMLLKADGEPYREQEQLTLPDLAMTYRAIAQHGPDWFYRGPFARQLDRWMKENGGIMTAEDLASYHIVHREPIQTEYRGYTIVGFPPPSSGGIHVAQILNILENFDLRALHNQDPSLMMHVVAEAMKLAFADRAYWLGDSDFVPVPRGLLSREYAKEQAKRIQLDRASAVEQHSLPPNWQTDVFAKHTTHITAADADGTWVAITATINTTFGSKVVVPGTGLVLNNEMDDFAIAPGVPNAFGLVGNENNAVAGGKRPLSSMSPTIILRDGQPVMTIGAAGGPKIITQVVLGIIQTIDLQQPLADAIAAPRWHQQWRPDRLLIEATVPPATIESLQAKGHIIEKSSTAGVTQAIRRSQGRFESVHDPRVPGQSLTW